MLEFTLPGHAVLSMGRQRLVRSKTTVGRGWEGKSKADYLLRRA